MADKERQTHAPVAGSPVVKGVAYALTFLILLAAVVPPLAPHVFLAWAAAHPAAYQQRDPRHWLRRLAALCVLAVYGQFLVQLSVGLWRAFRVWQCAFLPLPWERRVTQEAADGEPPEV